MTDLRSSHALAGAHPEGEGAWRIALTSSDLDVTGGIRLSGLTGRVTIQATGLRRLSILDSPALLALDLWGCPGGMLLDLAGLPALQEVFLAESGDGVSVHMTAHGPWQPVQLYGKVGECWLEMLDAGVDESLRGVYRFGASDGLELLPGDELAARGNVEHYLRIDQSQRGLQHKRTRRGAAPARILWQLQRPMAPRNHPIAWLCDRAHGKLHDADRDSMPSVSVAEHPDVVPATLFHFARLANRGLDAGRLWKIRSWFRQGQVQTDVCRSALEWPARLPLDKGMHRLEASDLDLFFHYVRSAPGRLGQRAFPAIVQVTQAHQLANAMSNLDSDRGDADRQLKTWAVGWLTRVLGDVERHARGEMQRPARRFDVAKCETTRLVTPGLLLSEIFDRVCELGDPACTAAVLELIRNRMPSADCLELGIRLALAGNVEGRALIVRGLGSGRPASERRRALAMELLLGAMPARQDAARHSG